MIIYWFLPGIIFLSLLFPKKKIINLRFSEDSLQEGRRFVLAYIVISFLALVVVAIASK